VLPAAPMLPRSVRVCGVGCVRRRGEPHTASHGPHPLFIALCDGGPPTMDWLGAPDQGAVSSPLRPLGRNGEEIELTRDASSHQWTTSSRSWTSSDTNATGVGASVRRRAARRRGIRLKKHDLCTWSERPYHLYLTIHNTCWIVHCLVQVSGCWSGEG
jgi:hypothetical protein